MSKKYKHVGPVITKGGVVIANRAERILNSKIGQYVEIMPDDIITRQVIIPKYRMRGGANPASNKRPYLILGVKDDPAVKLFFQQKHVRWADYRVGRYYINIGQIQVPEEEKSFTNTLTRDMYNRHNDILRRLSKEIYEISTNETVLNSRSTEEERLQED